MTQPPHRRILRAMLDGATLKAHRTLDGAKTYILHPLDGPDETVDRAEVEYLKRRGLIASNMKFPAATYMLTDNGLALADKIVSTQQRICGKIPTSHDG